MAVKTSLEKLRNDPCTSCLDIVITTVPAKPTVLSQLPGGSFCLTFWRLFLSLIFLKKKLFKNKILLCILPFS